MRSKLLSYALDFVSFVMQKIKDKDNIRHIILFGSVARGEENEDSDVDIFIDVVSEKNEEDIKQCKEDFYTSTKYKNYWKPLGIDNDIALKIGQLNKWEDLRSSIVANGILLYGKFKPELKEGAHQTFFMWENIKPNAKRVLLNKQLFGYHQNKKFYQGLLQRYNGQRLGKGSIGVPLEHANSVHNLFKKHNIDVKIKKVVSY